MLRLSALCAAAAAAATAAGGAVSIRGDIGVLSPVGLVPNFASTLTEWSYESWTSPLPAPELAAYPFLRSIELFTATGGCYLGFPGCASARDLLAEPSDAGSAFAFAPLVHALSNITASGLAPYVVTGNVPVAFSAPPYIGGFGFNSEPPANLTLYRAYIAGLASAAVAALGLDAVRAFRWGVFTEYNNADWLRSNASAYFALYDTTACALEDVLGAGHVRIGAHACTQCGGGAWDALALLDHVAGNGSLNACTGGAGAPMTFLSLSFYESEVGRPGDLGWIARDLLPAQARARALGLRNLTWGIDEGRLLQGVDGLPLASRAVGATYQASWDALFTSELVKNGFDYYSRWALNTGGGAAPAAAQVDPVSTNVAQLVYRMAGGALVLSSNASTGGSRRRRSALSPPSIVDALVSWSAASSTLRVLAFRHSVAGADNASDTAAVRVCGFAPPAAPPAAIAGVEWRVDDAHAQFWNAFQADVVAHNLTSFQPGWSPSGETVTLTNASEAAYFASRVPAYQALAALASAPVAATLDASGCLAFQTQFTGHAVQLTEWPALRPRAEA